jgi:hypothetical protein
MSVIDPATRFALGQTEAVLSAGLRCVVIVLGESKTRPTSDLSASARIGDREA